MMTSALKGNAFGYMCLCLLMTASKDQPWIRSGVELNFYIGSNLLPVYSSVISAVCKCL